MEVPVEKKGLPCSRGCDACVTLWWNDMSGI